MNQLIRVSLYGLIASGVCLFLAALETMTGLISWLAPSEVWLFVWLAIGIVCATIVRSYMQGAIAMPSIRSVAMPRMRTKYAKRTRRYI